MSAAALLRAAVVVLCSIVLPADALSSQRLVASPLRRDAPPAQDASPVAKPPRDAPPAPEGSSAAKPPHAVAQPGEGLSLAALATVARRQLQLPEEEAAPQAKVEHIELLNNVKFWGLMAIVIVAMSVAVVMVEVRVRDDEGASSDEEKLSKSVTSLYTVETVLHLLLCILAMNVSMLVWGIAQEFVMTNAWNDSNGNSREVPSSLFIVFSNRIITMAFTGSIILLRRGSVSFPGWEATALPALSNLVASWCAYLSLAHVTFGLQTTFKSAKLLPVVAISAMRGKKYSLVDYAEVAIIAAGVAVFGLESESNDLALHGKAVGVLLLCGLLLFDSVTPHLQDRLFESQPDLEAVHMTFGMALFASLVSLVILVGSGALFTCVQFCLDCPLALLHICVLGLSSTVTQYVITYTVKCYGPVVFTLINTTRQALSVMVSAVLFQHPVTGLEGVASMLVFGTVAVRALRPMLTGGGSHSVPRVPSDSRVTSGPGGQALLGDAGRSVESNLGKHYWQITLCAISIHTLLGTYSLLEEFLSTHSFGGEIFAYPSALVAANRSIVSLLALLILQLQGTPMWQPKLFYTCLPGVSTFAGALAHYQALYMVEYPTLTVLKMGKLIPAMLLGRVIKNRTYSLMDYLEAVLITVVGCFFIWNFEVSDVGITVGSHSSATSTLLWGIFLMVVYVAMDAVTCNLEDYVYQSSSLEAGHMMLGEGIFSALSAWVVLACSGELGNAVSFVQRHGEVGVYILMLGLAGACGTYACVLTVRLFGPMLFVMIMISRQIVSLVVSIIVYKHYISHLNLVAMVAVCLLILTASVRRAGGAQATAVIKGGLAGSPRKGPATPAEALADEPQTGGD